jgi:ABC-type antimicrobial peptide transport system permease subunit
MGGRSHIVVKTTRPFAAAAPAIRAAIARVLPASAPSPALHSLDDAFAVVTASRRALASIMLGFGVAVLLIGAGGVYTVTAAAVEARRKEFAIRIALGATSGRIVRQVLGQTTARLAVSVAIGLLAGGALLKVFGALLFAVQPAEPSIYLAVATLLSLSGIVATWLPARRAASAPPVTSLTSEASSF